MKVPGLNENHRRHLLASVQYAASLIRDCEEVLTASESPPELSRYTAGLTPPQRKIARDYLQRLQQQLLRFLDALGLSPPPPFIKPVRALGTAMIFLDDTFEEMRGRYMRGYGDVSPEAERILDGVVSEMQSLVREAEAFLTGAPADVLRDRLQRLPADHPVASDLRELTRIITEHGLVDLQPALAAIVERAMEDTFEVAVVGRVSSGKSTLLNAMLGSAVLPTGVLPVTAFPTRLRRGLTPTLRVTHANGNVEMCAVDRIGDFVTEAQNPGNEKRLARLLLEYPSDRLPDRVTFVDTPGLGSVASKGALQTFAYLPRCDHATFLLDATAPVADEDLTLLAFLQDAGITMSVLLSKADLLTTIDLARVQDYIAHHIRQRLGRDVRVRAVSAMPSHAPLLEAWMDEEVGPLGERARAHAWDGLIRKARLLRSQAALALEHSRRPQDRARVSAIDSEALVTRLRAMTARFEQTGRDLLVLPQHRADIVEAAVTAVTETLVERLRQPSDQTEDMMRAALMRPAQEVAETVARHLSVLSDEVRAALTEAAVVRGAEPSDVELPSVDREIPLLDLPPIAFDLEPPVWARISRGLLSRWVADRVRTDDEPLIERAVEAYLQVLRRWATDGLARLRREFESTSRPLLARLTGSASPDVSSGPARAIVERDLAWLRGERDVERAPGASVPRPLSTAHQE